MGRFKWLFVPAALLLTLAAGCGSSSSSGGTGSSSTSSGDSNVIVGAGSTLVAPIMSAWESDYSALYPVTVTYGAIGSGGGIAQITARTVDFGASDAPLTPDQAKAAKDVLEIPWALTGVVLAYNIPGVPNNLKLTGPVIADIYLGKITSWNDPQIANLNPGVKLPSLKITPVYRSDGSGHTYALTQYLSKVSPEFSSKIGYSTQVNWPTGVGGKGASGVAAAVSATSGAIGYVGIDYAAVNKINAAAVENAAGKFVVADVNSVNAAAATVTSIPPSNAISIVDPPASAAGAYPISTFTWALVPASSPKAAALKKFILYCLGPGQADAAKFYFGTMPPAVLSAAKATVGKIHT